LEINIFRLLDIDNTTYLQLVRAPSKNTFSTIWRPVCLIENSNSTGFTPVTTSGATSIIPSHFPNYTISPIASGNYPEWYSTTWGDIFTWEDRGDIKISHQTYQTIADDIFPTFRGQIAIKDNLIFLVISRPLEFSQLFSDGDLRILLEAKDKLFINKCIEASNSLQAQTPQHSFHDSFAGWLMNERGPTRLEEKPSLKLKLKRFGSGWKLD